MENATRIRIEKHKNKRKMKKVRTNTNFLSVSLIPCVRKHITDPNDIVENCNRKISLECAEKRNIKEKSVHLWH